MTSKFDEAVFDIDTFGNINREVIHAYFQIGSTLESSSDIVLSTIMSKDIREFCIDSTSRYIEIGELL